MGETHLFSFCSFQWISSVYSWFVQRRNDQFKLEGPGWVRVVRRYMWLAMSAEEEDVPEELEEQCTKCHVALAGIEQLLQSAMSISRTQMEEKVGF